MELILIIIIGYILYIVIWKPYFKEPFQEGLRGIDGKKVPKLYVEAKSRKSRGAREQVSTDFLKEKGDKFEKFIVKKFDKNYFTVKEWRSDKYIDGVYAESNMNPDLELEFHMKGFSTRFALECKYRSGLYNGYVELAKERQLHNYKQFETERKTSVYIALGLGGEPENPDELFLIPLKHLTSNKLSYDGLSRFKKEHTRQFYFDIQKRVLH